MTCRITMAWVAVALFSPLGVPRHATAQDASHAGPVKDLILPGESFRLDGRPAFIIWPAEENRHDPQPWVMYAPTLPGLPDRHEQWMHQQFLDAGVAVAGIDVGEAYGSPTGQQHFTALYRELTQQRGFAAKPCLLGRSRGGLWTSSWAIKHSDRVAGFAGIYPVFDLRTYPGIDRAASAYGLTPRQLQERLDEFNPIAQLDVLAKARVPVFIIHGDHDQIVPLEENSAALLQQYVQTGSGDDAELIVPAGQGHNYWPGFFHCQQLVDFVIERAKQGARNESNEAEPNPVSAATVCFKDLEYSRPDGLPLMLDLYRPSTFASPVPVVVWVHGGGWKNGSRARCPATWLVEHGYAVASIDYRLTDQARWPAQLNDCREAVRWLRQNAKSYGLDGEHIAAWGSSAGGHLVALLGTADAPPSESVSSRVQAVCDWFGPTDLLTMPPNLPEGGRTLEDIANSNGAKLLGGTVRDLPDLAKQASALYQVSADDPPFLIMHGEKDPRVPLDQSRRLHEALTAAGATSTLHIVEGAGHGGEEFQTTAAREIIRRFFDKHLRPAK